MPGIYEASKEAAKRKKAKDVGNQYKTAYGTYLGDYGSPRNPSFFGPDFEEMTALVRQRNRAAYGGITTDIREALGNAGLLGSGALPDALARAQIGMGQQVLGDINALYGQEYGQKRGFDINRALTLLGQDVEKAQQDQAREDAYWQAAISALPGIGMAVPGIAGLFSSPAPKK